MNLEYVHHTEDLTIRCTLDVDRETGWVYSLEIDEIAYHGTRFFKRFEQPGNEEAVEPLEQDIRDEIEEDDVLAAIRDRDEAARERAEEDGFKVRREAV